MTTVIACLAMQARTDTGTYLNPTDWKSLSQWWGLFRRVRLLSPAFEVKDPPPGWVKTPPFLETCGFFFREQEPNLLQRRTIVRRNARKLLQDAQMLYARMPCYEAYWVYTIARKMGIPVLTEFHGDWKSCVLTQLKGSILKRISRRFRANWAEKVTLDMAQHSIAVVTIGPVLAEQYVPKAKPLLVTTNHTMDEEDFSPRTDFTLKAPPRILFVGVLQERKGLYYLFQALNALKCSGQEFEFVAAGSGTEQAILEDYAIQNGFHDSVRFVGDIPLGPQLYEQYRRADIFVLPSAAAEGVPRVLQEAMALGCPTIATDIGSTRWQLRDGAGIVVAPGDPHALKENMLRVFNDCKLRRALSERGLATAREHTFQKQSAGIAEFVQSTVSPDVLSL